MKLQLTRMFSWSSFKILSEFSTNNLMSVIGRALFTSASKSCVRTHSPLRV